METNKTPTEQDFTEVFVAAVEQIKKGAVDAGSNLSEICREAGISRTTISRWTQKPPETIRIMSRLQEVVSDKAKALAEQS